MRISSKLVPLRTRPLLRLPAASRLLETRTIVAAGKPQVTPPRPIYFVPHVIVLRNLLAFDTCTIHPFPHLGKQFICSLLDRSLYSIQFTVLGQQR